MLRRIEKVLFLLGLCFVCVQAVWAQKIGGYSTRCDVGLKYELSYQPSWGDSHAIIVEVEPGSPADYAGLKVGDILVAIGDRSTQQMSEEEISGALLDPMASTVRLRISNFGYTNKPVALHKHCIPANALSEADLAQAYSLYSVEDVSTRKFQMPFTYRIPPKVDLQKYTSFSLSPQLQSDGVSQEFVRLLQSKGLKHLSEGGELLLAVRYDIRQNPKYREGVDGESQTFRQMRTNRLTGEVQDFPFLSLNAPSFFGRYQLTLLVEIYDQKSQELLWNCRATERLNEEYSAEQYAKVFGGLMMSNFPYLQYVMNPVFVVHRNNYRYLGIYYDMDDLQRVLHIDKGSPADEAGLRAGDRIVAINGLPLDSSVSKMSDTYRKFLGKTWGMRDGESSFTNADGVPQHMYWRVDKYLQVADKMQEPEHCGAFSYLFSHRTYVHSPIIKEILVELSDGRIIPIRPHLRQLDYITME